MLENFHGLSDSQLPSNVVLVIAFALPDEINVSMMWWQSE